MPKEKRIEARNEITKAHFNLGTGECMVLFAYSAIEFPAKSFSHDHYANLEVGVNQYDENLKIAAHVKQSHFKIGQGNEFFKDTMHKSAFSQNSYGNIQ